MFVLKSDSSSTFYTHFLRLLCIGVSSLVLFSCAAVEEDAGGKEKSKDAVSEISPVTPLTVFFSSDVVYFENGLSLQVDSGSDGDIEVFAVDDADSFEDAVPTVRVVGGTSINVVDILRVQSVDFSCDDKTSFSGIRTSNYKTGVVSFTGNVNGKNLSCTSTFQTVLDTTIPGIYSTAALLDGWGTDDDASKPIEETGLIKTSCSQGDDSDFDNVNPFANSCSGRFLKNYTVTDDNGGVHKISTKITFTSTDGSAPSVTPKLPVPPGIFPQIPGSAGAFPKIPGSSGSFPQVPGSPGRFPQIPAAG